MISSSYLLAAAMAVPAVMAAPAVTSVTSAPVPTTTVVPSSTFSAANTTQTFVPIAPSDSDKTGTVVPASNVIMYYGAADATTSGSIGMALDLSAPAVLLETIADITDVACPSGKVQVTFAQQSAYTEALAKWTAEDNLALITNHGADCDLTEDRGFFTANSAAGDAANLMITVNATRVNIPDIAHSMEMDFAAVPAALAPAVDQRITLETGFLVNFDLSVPATTLYDDGKYLSVKLDEASLKATVTLGGKLKFSFLSQTVETLYFDIDVDLDTKVELSADAKAQYKQAFTYAPGLIMYTLTDIPGVISLGPGIVFDISSTIDVDAAVGLDTAVTFGIPDGKIHWNVLTFNQSNATGWDVPEYSASLIFTEAVSGTITPAVDVSLQLAFELFNSLDLSSGIKFSPYLVNQISAIGEQGIIIKGTGSDVDVYSDLPASCDSSIKNGIAVKSKFYFGITGYDTQFWSGNIYLTTIPVADKCWTIPS